MYDQNHSSTLDSPLRELSVQSHLVQQRQHLRRQIRLTANLQCTRSPVTSVFFENIVHASCCGVGPPCICGEPPVNISTTLLESQADVFDVKTSRRLGIRQYQASEDCFFLFSVVLCEFVLASV